MNNYDAVNAAACAANKSQNYDIKLVTTKGNANWQITELGSDADAIDYLHDMFH